jgi:uncharacterized protein GlcG (DUF336 family)
MRSNDRRLINLNGTSLAACMIALALPSVAYSQSSRPYLQSETAQAIERAVIRCAAEKRYPAAVAIFDDSGRLLAYAHADGASTAAGDAAMWKGRSAAQYRYSTRATAAWNVPGAPDIATAPGGLPLVSKHGDALGGVGVSGGPAESDEACAAAGIAAAKLGNGPPE